MVAITFQHAPAIHFNVAKRSSSPLTATTRRSYFGQLRNHQSTRLRAGGDTEFELQYVEAVVDKVRDTEKYGHCLYLKLLDGEGNVLPVYIGDAECAALQKEMNKTKGTRPMTHDLMKNCLEVLGYRVTKVCVTALVANTYHARVHLARGFRRLEGGRILQDSDYHAVDVDARPSDAINLAVRFGAPVYVSRDVARKMAESAQSYQESSQEVVKSCKAEMLKFHDPTVMYKLQLELAIKEERYDDAAACRDKIDRLLANDRALSLVVAMETALEDGRYEEAARLRDEFKRQTSKAEQQQY